jgi:hypothetical protein
LFSDGERYFIEKDSLGLTELPYEEAVQTIDGQRFASPSTKHIGLLNYYLQDAPNIKGQIERVKKPNRDNLVKLAENYHNAVCKDEICLIYERQPPSVMVFIELAAAYAAYKYPGSGYESSFSKGIIFHISSPRTNERLFFRVGIMSTTVPHEEGTTSSNRISFHAEYMTVHKRINPRISYGTNSYNDFRGTVSLSTGVLIKLGNKLYTSISPELEFNRNKFIFPKGMVGYNVQASLSVKL